MIVVLFAWKGPRTSLRRFLVAAFALTVFFSLGSALHVAGHRVVALPWDAVVGLPIWDNVLTVRFAMYVSLVVGVIAALWTAAQPAGSTRRWLMPGLAMVALVPNPWSKDWATTYSIPRFFTAAEYRGCLRPGEIVMPAPISVGGDSMLWQVADDFRFRMAGGRITQQPPSPFMNPPSIEVITRGKSLTRGQAGLARAFIRAKGVTSVVADKELGRPWLPGLDLIAKRQDVGGVYLYRTSRGARPCPSAG